jgi:hypothetical protein
MRWSTCWNLLTWYWPCWAQADGWGQSCVLSQMTPPAGRQTWQWCSLTLVLIRQPVYPIHTLLYMQWTLYKSGDLRPMSFLTGCSSHRFPSFVGQPFWYVLTPSFQMQVKALSTNWRKATLHGSLDVVKSAEVSLKHIGFLLSYICCFKGWFEVCHFQLVNPFSHIWLWSYVLQQTEPDTSTLGGHGIILHSGTDLCGSLFHVLCNSRSHLFLSKYQCPGTSFPILMLAIS